MFKPSNMLLKALSEENVDMYDIVGALMGYINSDLYFKTDSFESAIGYVLDKGVSETELFSSFDSTLDFEEDKKRWNEDYYAMARVYLKENFCKKRINHVKEIALYLESNKEIINLNQARSSEHQVNLRVDKGGKKSPKESVGQNHKKKRIKTSRVVAAIGIVLLVVFIVILALKVVQKG